jgi:hypothetical protein
VIIIGGGIAGLVATFELARQGHEPLILEATYRVGGRVKTIRDFAPGLYAEARAMRIPRVHDLTLAYCELFGLELRPFVMGNPKTLVHINGQRMTVEEADAHPDRLPFDLADHEKGNVAYYLPDEIDLRMLAPDRPDISLQVFYPDQATVGGSASLDKAVGSILSLGVQCRLSPAREELLRSKVAALLGGTSDLRLGPPPWEDGTVDLLLLDSQSGETLASAVKDDRMVRGVVGSRRPSLSDGLLSGIFHARLDRRGTALVAAAINGEVGSLAGVLYDLKFSALRPTVDLRMSANLDRCAEVFRAAIHQVPGDGDEIRFR